MRGCMVAPSQVRELKLFALAACASYISRTFTGA